MSDLTAQDHAPTPCAAGAQKDTLDLLEARVARVGTKLTIRRAIPQKGRRMIGAWCFLDHFGPIAFESRREGMWVGSHPHMGLQTVTWLMEGEVLHRDSLGTEAVIRPGSLNVMTAGRGISHTEESPANGGRLHGLQLWLALPDAERDCPPAFEQVTDLPVYRDDGMEATVFIGEGFGLKSPAAVFSPLIGADVNVPTMGEYHLDLDPGFEHGLVVTEGIVAIGGELIEPGQLLYLAPGRSSLHFRVPGAARFGLVGGAPFDEEVLLWWNFVGRANDELRQARADWIRGDRFGEVAGFDGDRLDVPDWTHELKAKR